MERSKEQIEVWKKQFGKVYCVSVQDDDNTYHCYMKRPTVETLSAVVKYAESDPIKSAEVLYKNCTIEADVEIQEDVLLQLQVSKAFSKIIEEAKTTIKKL